MRRHLAARVAVAALPALLFLGCVRSIPRETIQSGPGKKLERMKPEVVESSAPLSPDWTGLREKERGSVAKVAFVGESTAPTLDAAKERATRDLYSAIASFVSVDVESAFEDVQASSKTSAGSSESQDIRSETRSHADAELRG